MKRIGTVVVTVVYDDNADKTLPWLKFGFRAQDNESADDRWALLTLLSEQDLP